LGKIGTQALTTGLTSGTISVLMGGDFWDSFGQGIISGGVSGYLNSKTKFAENDFLNNIKKWFNNAFGQFAGTGEYSLKASDALALCGASNAISEALMNAVNPSSIATNDTTTDVEYDLSGAVLEGGTLLASNNTSVNRQATPAQVNGVIKVTATTRDAKGRIVQQKTDYILNGKTVKTIIASYTNGKMTGRTVLDYTTDVGKSTSRNTNNWGFSGGITWAEWGVEAGVVGLSGGAKNTKWFLSGSILFMSGEVGLDVSKLKFYAETDMAPFTLRLGPLYVDWSLVDFTKDFWGHIPDWGTKDWSIIK
jgi:hypothetical protein